MHGAGWLSTVPAGLSRMEGFAKAVQSASALRSANAVIMCLVLSTLVWKVAERGRTLLDTQHLAGYGRFEGHVTLQCFVNQCSEVGMGAQSGLILTISKELDLDQPALLSIRGRGTSTRCHCVTKVSYILIRFHTYASGFMTCC